MRRSTRSCRSACSCRRATDDVATAIAIARDLKVPVLPRGAGTSQCGQTTGAALVIDTSKHLRRVLEFDIDATHRHGRARHGARPPERAAEAARPVVPGRRLDQRAGHARRHGGQQLLRQPLASPTATWCTTWPASSAWLADGTLAGLRPRGARCGRAKRRSPTSCAAWPSSTAPRSSARWPKVLRRVGGYNLDIFAHAERAALHRRRQRQPGAPAGRRRRHAGLHAQPDAASSAALPRAKVLGVVNFPSFHARDGCGAAHRQAGADRGRTGRPHDDRAEPRQPGVPADRRDGADRRSRAAILLVEFSGDDKAALLRAARRAGRTDGRPGAARQRGRDARRGAAEGAVGGAQGRPEHHDEPEGRRQAGELHRGLRGAAASTWPSTPTR